MGEEIRKWLVMLRSVAVCSAEYPAAAGANFD
jgi:hypothetical protein